MKCFNQLWGFICSNPTLGVCACIPVALGFLTGDMMTPRAIPRPPQAPPQQVFLLSSAPACTAISLHSTLFNPLFSLFTLPKQAEKLQLTAWLSQGILKFSLKLMHHYFGCNLVRHQPASGTTHPSASWSGFFSVRCLKSSTARFSLYKNIQTKKFSLPGLSFWTKQMVENKQTNKQNTEKEKQNQIKINPTFCLVASW